MRNVCNFLVGKREGKRLLARPRCRWEDNIQLDPKETGLEGVDWINLAQDRDRRLILVKTVMNVQVP
jgi:hypothetical protein